MATGLIYFYQNWKDWESSDLVSGEIIGAIGAPRRLALEHRASE